SDAARDTIPIEPAAPLVLHLPRLRALALLRRRPAARVESTTSRRPRNLVWGGFCQGGALRGLSIFFNVSFLVRLGQPVSSPRPIRNEVAGARRSGQGWRVAPPARASSLTG